MKNKLIWLIFLLALLVRFIGIQSLPPALNRDEAAIGYNAYSILKTARDEHGQFLPLAFKSIGDYKMPLYIYATTIPVKIIGLNNFSIRFWSALAGSISTLALYFIVINLTKKRNLATIAAALLALNPWAIFYSRIGFEANLSLAFFLSGFALLLYGLKSFWRFNLSLLLFLLAFLTYSSSLIFIPLFLTVFLILKKSSLDKKRVLSLVIFALLSAIIFKSLWNISAQKANITVFSNPTIINTYNQTRTEIFETNPILARTWWNKNVYFARLITANYLKTFSPKFLLTVGGNHPWHRTPGVGNFYFIEIIFAFIGIYYLLKSKNNTKLKIILFSWFLLAPLASAITVDAPHSTRSLHLLPVILIFTALGTQQLFQKGPSFKDGPFWKKIIIGFYLVNLIYAGHQYITVYPKKFPGSIPLGLKELITQNDLSGNLYFHGIHNSNYLYPLVYQQTDPQEFQSSAVWTLPDLTNLTNVYQFKGVTIVDYIKDIKDASFVFWRTTQPLNIPNLKLIDQSGYYSLYQAY